jgi:Type II secretion system (T2SS), protein E, N-terminal domain
VTTFAPTLADLRQAGVLALTDVLVGRPGERPEDVLLDLKLVDDRALALALAFRSGFPYRGLRHFAPDHRLFLYLPVHVAQRERVCPLELDDGELLVASAYLDPDLTHVTERFPGVSISLAVSPRSEVLEALQRIGI